jgi:hypothetical protein
MLLSKYPTRGTHLPVELDKVLKSTVALQERQLPALSQARQSMGQGWQVRDAVFWMKRSGQAKEWQRLSVCRKYPAEQVVQRVRDEHLAHPVGQGGQT